MDDEQYYQWEEAINRVARNTAKDFPDSNVEDLVQEIWVGLLEEIQKDPSLSIYDKYAESGLYFLAKSAAWRERKEHLTISTQYGYRTKDVRALLETFFDRESWGEAITPDDAASELNDVGLEMSSDLSRAWDILSYPHKVLIFKQFGLKEKQDSKKLSKAISRMADIINTYHYGLRKNPGPGARRVITNSGARATIQNEYGGEPLRYNWKNDGRWTNQ